MNHYLKNREVDETDLRRLEIFKRINFVFSFFLLKFFSFFLG